VAHAGGSLDECWPAAEQRAAIDGASDRPRGYFLTKQYATITGDAFVKDVRATVKAIRDSATTVCFR